MRKIFNALFAVVLLVMVVNTYFLHHATEKLKVQEVTIRRELFKELDSMAWVYNVHPNTKYVTGTKRYYKCDVVKKRIEQELK